MNKTNWFFDLKKRIKQLIKKAILCLMIRGCQYESDNRTILFRFMNHRLRGSLIVGGYKEQINDGFAVIPLDKTEIPNRVKLEVEVTVRILSRNIRITIPKSRLVHVGDFLTIGTKKYPYSEAVRGFIEGAEFNQNELLINVNVVSIDDSELEYYCLDSNNDMIDSGRFDNGVISISKAHLDAYKNDPLQIALISGEEANYLTLLCEPDALQGYSFYEYFGRVFVSAEKSEGFTFIPTLERIPRLAKASKTFSEVVFDNGNGVLHIKNSGLTDYTSVQFYLENTSNNQKTLLLDSAKASEYSISGFMEKPIDHIERFYFLYETKNKGKLIEHNYLKERKHNQRTLEKRTMFLANNNRLIVSRDGSLVVENADNFLSYNEKYNIDLEKTTFKTDFDIKEVTAQGLLLQLCVRSLLSPMEKIVISAADAYEKKTYLIDEIAFQPTYLFDKEINISFSNIYNSFYHNMRLMFKIGVIYVDGYSEQGFILKDPFIEEKSLCRCKLNDSLDIIVQIGENLNNLQLWLTTIDEYHKARVFQRAKGCPGHSN